MSQKGFKTTTLSVMLTTLITLVLIIFGTLNIMASRARLSADLESTKQCIAMRLSKSLETPVWDMNTALVEQFVVTEMGEATLAAVLVYEPDHKKLMVGRGRNAEGTIEPIQESPVDAHLLTASLPIQKEKDLIGHVDVFVTTLPMKAALRAEILQTSVGIFIVALLLAIALKVSIKLFVVRPIRQVIDGLSEKTVAVTETSHQISASSQALASASNEQSSGLEETAASIAEAASMTKNNADYAHQADATMGASNRKFQQLTEAMARMSATITEIKTSTTQTASIIKTIDEIAFQTNLLALNAAVEAARAGEAGKGFAVVAEEVRNLARRSAEAAKHTTELLESSRKSAESGVVVNDEVGKAAKGLKEDSEKISTLIAEIASAAKEQALGIEQINTAVSEMEKTVQQNAATAEESAGVADSLNLQASELSEIVDLLKSFVGAGRNGHSGSKTLKSPAVAQTARTVAKTKPAPAKKAIAAKPQPQNPASKARPEEVIPLDDAEFKDF